jgi:hypothetical protein
VDAGTPHRGALLAAVIVLVALDDEIYATSVIFGGLFVGLSDPGGDYRGRVIAMTGVALIGVLLTLWGVGVGDGAWGLVVVSVFVVTLAGGLSIKFGTHRFTATLLLNVWFVVALAMPVNSALEGDQSHAWSQTLAWLVGSALWRCRRNGHRLRTR